MKKRILKNLVEKEPEKITEREVWLKAWCAVANAFNCETSDAATKWADACLKDFKERFKNSVLS